MAKIMDQHINLIPARTEAAGIPSQKRNKLIAGALVGAAALGAIGMNFVKSEPAAEKVNTNNTFRADNKPSVTPQQLPENPSEMQVAVPPVPVESSPVVTAAPNIPKVVSSEKNDTQEYDKIMKSIAYHKVGDELTVISAGTIRVNKGADVRTGPSGSKSSAVTFENDQPLTVFNGMYVEFEGKKWVAWVRENPGEDSVQAVEITEENAKNISVQKDRDGDGNAEWGQFTLGVDDITKTIRVDQVEKANEKGGIGYSDSIGPLGLSLEFESEHING